MLKAIEASLSFMTSKERSKWLFLTGARGLLSILDLVGILSIGFVVTSTAIFLTQGSSSNRILDFVGLQIPAVTAQTLPLVATAILAVFLIKAVLSIVVTKRLAYFVAKVEAKAAKSIAQSVFGHDLAQARYRSREEMSYAVQFGSPAAFNYLLNYTSTVIAEGSLFLIVCLGFLLIDPLATLAALGYFAAIAFVIQYFVGTLMTKAAATAVKGTIAANRAVGDLVAVFRELSVLGLRHTYINRLYQARVAAANSAATQTYLNGMPRYVVEAALLIGVVAFILVQSLTNDIVSSATTVGVFLSGGFRLTAALLPLQNALLGAMAQIPVAKTAQDILFEYQSRHESIEQGQQAKKSKLSGRGPVQVELRNVSFTYSAADAEAIKNVSITIEPGHQVAIIGPSGAGKSTIADLICGVSLPTAGNVSLSIGDQHLSLGDASSVSYVPQNPGVVSGTVSENVALGVNTESINEDKVWESLERAHLKNEIASLPEGLKSDLGNYQEGLSGGQIQRLGLARALYTNPGLLVMDEATSALDADSEAQIANALNDIRGSVTVVLIAHRLNTVQHADTVFLVQGGEIKDQGTFQELLRRNPSIERLVQLMKVDEN
jgi:ABC-type bacteriocin/lantibiotic exporter with double-glycine peptidase domain